MPKTRGDSAKKPLKVYFIKFRRWVRCKNDEPAPDVNVSPTKVLERSYSRATKNIKWTKSTR